MEPHRRELHVHCYRLLSLFEEAEDLVQEAFLRAWCRRETYEGRSSVRAWLYRIATNVCLDALDKPPRRPSSKGEIAWLQPYPNELLEQLPDRREGPEDVTLAKETAAERELLARCVDCGQRVESAGLIALLHSDVRFSMPPYPGLWAGRDVVVQGWIDGGFGSDVFGSTRCALTRANGQPAVAAYTRKPGDTVFEPLAVDVLQVQNGVITEITTFDRAVFDYFNLPITLDASDG